MADPQSEPELHSTTFPLVGNISPVVEPKEDGVLGINGRPNVRRRRTQPISRYRRGAPTEMANIYYDMIMKNEVQGDDAGSRKTETWRETIEEGCDYGKQPYGINGNEDIVQEEPPNSPENNSAMEIMDNDHPTPAMEAISCVPMESSELNCSLPDTDCPSFSLKDRELAYLKHQEIVNNFIYSDEERRFLRHKVETFTREQCVLHCILGHILHAPDEVLGNRLEMPTPDDSRQALLCMAVGSHWDVYNLAIVCAFSEKLNVDKLVSKTFHGSPFFSSCASFAPNAIEFRRRLTNYLRRLLLE